MGIKLPIAYTIRKRGSINILVRRLLVVVTLTYSHHVTEHLFRLPKRYRSTLSWKLLSIQDVSVLGYDSGDLRPLSEFKFFHENRNSRKTDVLDSISNSYEGTRKILADSEPKGPSYIPSDIKIDYRTDFPLPDLPHPTVDIGNRFYIKSPLKSIYVHEIWNQKGDYALHAVKFVLVRLFGQISFLIQSHPVFGKLNIRSRACLLNHPW